MKKHLSLKVVWKRLCMQSPSFFKRVQAIGASLGAGSIAARVAFDDIPAYLERPLEYGIVAGVISIFIAKLTVQNPEDIHKDNECGKA